MRQASSSEIQRARFLEGGVGLVSGCDWMIIDVSWNFTWKFSWLKCFLLGHKCYRLYYIDDLSLMTGKIEDLQKALDIIEFSFGFKVNIKKTEIVFLALEEPAHLMCRFIIVDSLLKLSSLLNI